MNLEIELPPLNDDSPLGRFVARARRTEPIVFLVFHARNGRPLPAQPLPPRSGYEWLTPEETRDLTPLPNVLALKIVRRPRTIDRERLVLASRDGKLELTQLVYAVGKNRRAVDLPPQERDLGAARALRPRARELAPSYRDASELWNWDGEQTPSFGPVEYLRELQHLIQQGSDRPIRRYRWFFFDLDRNTEGTLLKAHVEPDELVEERLWNLRLVNRAIEARSMERLREHVDAPSRCTRFSDWKSFKGYVQYVSDLFLGLVHEHFHAPDGPLDYDAFEDAFEMFANGELRLQLRDATPGQVKLEPVWTTQPSSGSFFRFGEFALLAAECDVEAKTWDRLANVMIRTRHVFCDVYAPNGASEPRKLSDYAGSDFHEDRRFSARQKQLLREAYQGFSHDDLCRASADLVASYAPGEFKLVNRLPPPHRNAPSEGLHIRALYPRPRPVAGAEMQTAPQTP